MEQNLIDALKILTAEQTIYCNWTNEKGLQKIWHGRIMKTGVSLLTIELAILDEDYKDSPTCGTPIHCSVLDDRCTYHFDTIFHGSAALPDHVWFIDMPQQAERRQSRSFVRVPVELPMRVWLTNAYGGRCNPISTSLVDISGGGICFVMKKEVPEKSNIQIEIKDLPLIGTLNTSAEVKRCEAIEVLASTVYHIGASLLLEKAAENKLVRSVFQLQRQFLHRGLGV
jgi:c-di-GMP-binding flagellar brake protein YcgR